MIAIDEPCDNVLWRVSGETGAGGLGFGRPIDRRRLTAGGSDRAGSRPEACDRVVTNACAVVWARRLADPYEVCSWVERTECRIGRWWCGPGQ